ncbi:ammonia-dependent NAD(+) synthetase [Halomonas sp. EF61]|uniref:ammonia-dependent NAD(+) synthetase n=1 Tax=Halomonas sp. EF61 TaxID=2950869 RepID=UPI0032DF22AA
MTHDDIDQLQRIIARELEVQPGADIRDEIQRRQAFLIDQLHTTGQHCLVLGISGGVDSTSAGLLAQRAVEAARERLPEARFIAMRLPYGEQQDDDDARQALDAIQPDECLTVNIKPASDAMLEALEQAGLEFRDQAHRDFVMGNIKARQRMIAQYAVAGAQGGLVIGTDQAAEAVMGFYTKHGDGACDLVPLAGLTKGQVRDIAAQLGAPDTLVNKVPTADLESLRPQLSDEEALGVSYAAIDRFLTGESVAPEDAERIIATWRRTAHKRAMPRTP